MPARRFIGLVALVWSVAAVAEPVDGTAPLNCEAEKAHDCMPGKPACEPMKSETKVKPVLRIDFAKREVRSPFRKELLQVNHATTTSESLILQGGEESGFAWSALVRKKDGTFTISIADREGSYVVFGTCRKV